MRDSGIASPPLVLLVEDEPGLAKLMTFMLEDEGFEVVVAANGREGLKLLAQQRPELIITDYMMPEMNGAEMIRAIRAEAAYDTIPIMLMSAALPVELVTQSLADRFLAKGASLDTILKAVNELIELC
ncbi:response regulator [Stutzerimonas azotifigens]|uniref:Response regulator n=1 Tax=Stutzerimonas azotifigens TaxID=291995 RepID=A0ABR5YWI1_9GAMM|nr:response regulator [Stutzerimonas azotifigens]MBA1272281.1 response regulator [Stutzerimonas azotifigens]